MKFLINKCGILILKRGYVVRSTGVLLPNGKLLKAIDEGGYKYLGILESDKIMEYKRRVSLVLKS